MKRFSIFSVIAGLFGSLFTTQAAAPTTLQQPDWSRNAVIYEVNWRQMTPGGTLPELTDQLPRLKDLGLTAL